MSSGSRLKDHPVIDDLCVKLNLGRMRERAVLQYCHNYGPRSLNCICRSRERTDVRVCFQALGGSASAEAASDTLPPFLPPPASTLSLPPSLSSHCQCPLGERTVNYNLSSGAERIRFPQG
ncbi:Hypothetical predicted protein [Xyrichtys novacula]|uniref:Uncharacterized protein n=1 Tax=Xyrichtys novacula TaxID=13765 RepID=A0AAV1G115_XYRNO|nr:Hypothetical predicted protein [Xyrichtys novacula]